MLSLHSFAQIVAVRSKI